MIPTNSAVRKYQFIELFNKTAFMEMKTENNVIWFLEISLTFAPIIKL